ncbi:hypothetical protein DFJ77DRAFT_447218 [Powellomyces hirtus]|nr:hypothetical protein DFJ77DRAFT_447218 [Powellomyces hirtus]
MSLSSEASRWLGSIPAMNKLLPYHYDNVPLSMDSNPVMRHINRVVTLRRACQEESHRQTLPAPRHTDHSLSLQTNRQAGHGVCDLEKQSETCPATVWRKASAPKDGAVRIERRHSQSELQTGRKRHRSKSLEGNPRAAKAMRRNSGDIGPTHAAADGHLILSDGAKIDRYVPSPKPDHWEERRNSYGSSSDFVADERDPKRGTGFVDRRSRTHTDEEKSQGPWGRPRELVLDPADASTIRERFQDIESTNNGNVHAQNVSKGETSPRGTLSSSSKPHPKLKTRGCTHFARGTCRYGDSCHFIHARLDPNVSDKHALQRNILQSSSMKLSPSNRAAFEDLIAVLQSLISEGQTRPLRSLVGSRLVERNPRLYQRSGGPLTFKEYVQDAEDNGLVTTGGEYNPTKWVSLSAPVLPESEIVNLWKLLEKPFETASGPTSLALPPSRTLTSETNPPDVKSDDSQLGGVPNRTQQVVETDLERRQDAGDQGKDVRLNYIIKREHSELHKDLRQQLLTTDIYDAAPNFSSQTPSEWQKAATAMSGDAINREKERESLSAPGEGSAIKTEEQKERSRDDPVVRFKKRHLTSDPDYKTRMCKEFQDHAYCKYGKDCYDLHTVGDKTGDSDSTCSARRALVDRIASSRNSQEQRDRAHSDDSADVKTTLVTMRPPKLCSTFMERGTCAYGSKCWFLHPIDRDVRDLRKPTRRSDSRGSSPESSSPSRNALDLRNSIVRSESRTDSPQRVPAVVLDLRKAAHSSDSRVSSQERIYGDDKDPHKSALSASLRLCPSLVYEGRCSFGARCLLLHPPYGDRDGIKRSTAKFSTTLCIRFLQGRCTYHDKCFYLHTDTSDWQCKNEVDRRVLLALNRMAPASVADRDNDDEAGPTRKVSIVGDERSSQPSGTRRHPMLVEERQKSIIIVKERAVPRTETMDIQPAMETLDIQPAMEMMDIQTAAETTVAVGPAIIANLCLSPTGCDLVPNGASAPGPKHENFIRRISIISSDEGCDSHHSPATQEMYHLDKQAAPAHSGPEPCASSSSSSVRIALSAKPASVRPGNVLDPKRGSRKGSSDSKVPATTQELSSPALGALITQTYNLSKANGIYVAKVRFAKLKIEHSIAVELAAELTTAEEATGPLLCVKYMVSDDHIKEALEINSLKGPFDHGTLEVLLPQEVDAVKKMLTFLSDNKRTGIIPLKTVTIFLMPTKARDLFKLSVDDSKLLHCVFMDNRSVSNELRLTGMRREVKMPSPLQMSVEQRMTLLQAIYCLPPNFQWLVDGKMVFLFSPPQILATTEMRWLLQHRGAQVVTDPAECHLVLCHRWYHDKIGLLPNLVTMKRKFVEFVLWGQSCSAYRQYPESTESPFVQRPLQLFPGGGGIVTLTAEALVTTEGLQFLQYFDGFAKMQADNRQWGCVLHPEVYLKIKQSADGRGATDVTCASASASLALFYMRRLRDLGCLMIASEAHVEDENDNFTGPGGEFCLMVRLQYSWSLNFRHFVLLSMVRPEDRANGDHPISVGGIEEMTVLEFMNRYPPLPAPTTHRNSQSVLIKQPKFGGVQICL